MATNKNDMNFGYSDALAGDDIEDLLAGGADVDDLIGAGLLNDTYESVQQKAERESTEERAYAISRAIGADAERTGNVVTNF